MILPLYSNAHLEEAKLLFPEKFKDSSWFDSQWTTDEINKCKDLSFDKDVNNMSKDEYEYCFDLNPISKQNKNINVFLRKQIPNKKVKILSLGCGYGDKEIYLSRQGYKITATDNSPIIKILKKLYSNEVDFASQNDARFLQFPDKSFDMILMLNVIYAIPNSDLRQLFSEFNRVLKKDGGFIISSSATLGLSKIVLYNIKILYRLFFKKKLSLNLLLKRTGWQRDRREIEKYLPYYDYKSINYDGSVCLEMKFGRNILNRIAYLFLKVFYFETYYDFWIAKGKK